MYKPMVAIEVAAENATLEPRDGIASRKDSVAASQMVLIGDLKRASTWNTVSCLIDLACSYVLVDVPWDSDTSGDSILGVDGPC